MDKGLAVRDSRGRPHGGRGHGYGDSQLTRRLLKCGKSLRSSAPSARTGTIDHQEQEDHHGAAGNEEILPQVPQAPGAQGNQVDWNQVASFATGERGVGLTADQRSPKPRVGVRIPPPLPKPKCPKKGNDPEAQSKRLGSRLKSGRRSPRIILGSCKLEMKRVTWPNRKQVEGTTAIVILTVFAFAAYFKVVDSVIVEMVNGVQRAFQGEAIRMPEESICVG